MFATDFMSKSQVNQDEEKKTYATNKLKSSNTVQTRSVFIPRSVDAKAYENCRSDNTTPPMQFRPSMTYSPSQTQTIQKQEQESTSTNSDESNETGIPTPIKNHFESLSGFSFDDVKVHYNSDKPAQLQALAYTQGNQVYVAPGQEKHLGHELGHVVQQKQGIVRPTGNINRIPFNDSISLESEADVYSNSLSNTVQYKKEKNIVNSISTSEVVQAQIFALNENECEYNASLGTDEITYPNINSCLGVTVAIDTVDSERLLGGHLVMNTFEEEPRTRPSYAEERAKAQIDLGKSKNIINHLFDAVNANPDNSYVHITAFGDLADDVNLHMSFLTSTATALGENAENESDRLNQLYAKSLTARERWTHHRYEKVIEEGVGHTYKEGTSIMPVKYNDAVGDHQSLDTVNYTPTA